MSQPAIHIYSAPGQPMTRYVDDCDGPKFKRVVKHKPLELFYCENCRKQRRAKNLKIQVYYNCTKIFCADKAKCKKER